MPCPRRSPPLYQRLVRVLRQATATPVLDLGDGAELAPVVALGELHIRDVCRGPVYVGVLAQTHPLPLPDGGAEVLLELHLREVGEDRVSVLGCSLLRLPQELHLLHVLPEHLVPVLILPPAGSRALSSRTETLSLCR